MVPTKVLSNVLRTSHLVRAPYVRVTVSARDRASRTSRARMSVRHAHQSVYVRVQMVHGLTWVPSQPVRHWFAHVTLVRIGARDVTNDVRVLIVYQLQCVSARYVLIPPVERQCFYPNGLTKVYNGRFFVN